MADLNNTNELENELIKRNREIAHVKDEKLKLQHKIEDMQIRNDELLEKQADLDSQVNVWRGKATELEEACENHKAATQARLEEIEQIKENHAKEIEAVRNGAEASEQLTVMMERLQKEVDEERKAHGMTKTVLETSEQAARDSLKKVADSFQKLKELEEDKENLRCVMQRKLDEEQAKRYESEQVQLTAQSEVDNIKSELHRHEALTQDLEAQVKEAEDALETCRTELADAKNEIEEHHSIVARLQAEHDEAVKKLDESASTNNIQEDEQKRQQEQLRRGKEQIVQLEGRLESQKYMLEQNQEALQKSQIEEERLTGELASKEQALEKSQQESKEALEYMAEKAQQDLDQLEKKLAAQHEAEISEAKAQARSELDATNRALAEVQEQARLLEARAASARADHEDAVGSGERQVTLLRDQIADLRQRITEGEEKLWDSQREIDKLKTELQEKSNEAERVAVEHRLEVEKLEQTMEAERQSRLSQDKISDSKMEEKDTLLQHRTADIERLEQDLEDMKKKCIGMEEEVGKVSQAGEDRARQLGVRNAQLEGEIRTRTERMTELESRLDAQRSYLEQLNETVQKVHSEKDFLMETKGALEAQLKLESTHKDAVSTSLKQMQEDEERRRKELEDQLEHERRVAKESMEESTRAYAEEIKQTSEKVASLEAELLSSRQQCEDLLRLKGDLQQEIMQYREQAATFDSKGASFRAENEKMLVELEQLRQSKASLEEDLTRSVEEQRQGAVKIEELGGSLKELQQQQAAQRDEFSVKLQKLNELLDSERESHASTERTLAASRTDKEELAGHQDSERRRLESKVQQTQVLADEYRDKASEAESQVRRLEKELQEAEVRCSQLKEQAQGQRSKLDASEQEHRNHEAEISATCRRLQAELDDHKASVAQQTTVHTARVASLERQLESEASVARAAGLAREAAENQLRRHEDERVSLRERAAMAEEELATRQVEFAIEIRKNKGALEESRRTLRSTLGAPTPPAATATIDGAKVQSLEKTLGEERRKNIEQAVALQRAERKLAQLESSAKKNEDLRSTLAQQAREAERTVKTLTEDLRKSKLAQATNEQASSEAREVAAMSGAELYTVRYEARYQLTKLRGELEEYKWCAKSRAQQSR
mmetsp:Transcript_287/g.970  ORF Transcript_287/g.970 Transcript_287/m.970 type:complete len:1128 (+) Transcript_287:69-3452(+)